MRQPREDPGPQRHELGALGCGRSAVQRRPIPVEQQFRLDGQRAAVVGRHAVHAVAVEAAASAAAARPAARPALRWRRATARLVGAAGLHLAAEDAVAEILEQQEAVVEILRVDARRAEARARSALATATNGRTSSARCAMRL